MTRDADIARIAAVLHEAGLSGWQRGVGHQLADDHATALYDAGLRPSVEPPDVTRLADIAEMAAGEVMTGNDYARYHKAIRQHFVDRLTRAAEYARLSEAR